MEKVRSSYVKLCVKDELGNVLSFDSQYGGVQILDGVPSDVEFRIVPSRMLLRTTLGMSGLSVDTLKKWNREEYQGQKDIISDPECVENW